MRPISTGGFKKPRSMSAGADPILRWLPIADLIVDPALQQPISRRGRRNVNRIAEAFSWSCFSPVIVAPFAQDKFVIIDGQHRTTAAALIGFDRVPCQVVTGSPAQLAVARKAINGQVTSRLALHGAATDATKFWPSSCLIFVPAPTLNCCATPSPSIGRPPVRPWRLARSRNALSATTRKRSFRRCSA